MKIKKLNFTNESVEVVTEENTYLISINHYIEHQFVTNQEVDKKLLMNLQKELKLLDIEQYLLKLLSSQDCCSFYLKRKLLEKYKNKDDKIDELLKKYTQMGYINDNEFLNNFIDKKLNKFIGIQRIVFELEKIGFENQNIFKHINQNHYDIELSKAMEIAIKINSNSKEKSDRKIINKLSYAGYSVDLIEKVLSKLGLLDDNLML